MKVASKPQLFWQASTISKACDDNLRQFFFSGQIFFILLFFLFSSSFLWNSLFSHKDAVRSVLYVDCNQIVTREEVVLIYWSYVAGLQQFLFGAIWMELKVTLFYYIAMEWKEIPKAICRRNLGAWPFFKSLFSNMFLKKCYYSINAIFAEIIYFLKSSFWWNVDTRFMFTIAFPDYRYDLKPCKLLVHVVWEGNSQKPAQKISEPDWSWNLL